MEGYKHTELGWIPEDWEVKKVGDVCDFIVPGRNKPKDFNGDIPWITTPDINHNSTVFVSKQNLCISREEAKSVGTKIVSKGSVIISCVGDLGLVAIAGNDIVINQQLHAFLPNDKINSNYLLYALTIQTRYMEKVATKTAVPYMNKENCNSIPILFPSITEQKRIARILLVWDKSIETLTQLIAAKQQLKKGLMQQLLTPKNKWNKYYLGDLAKIGTGGKDNQNKVKNGEYPFFVRSQIVERINTYSYDGEAILIPGEGGIGEIIHYINGKFDFHQRVYKISDFDSSVSGKYLYYFLQLNFKKAAAQDSVKATVDSLRLPTFLKMEVQMPSLDEQKKIANCLTFSDKEIEFLKDKLSLYKLQKQGLMQQLLTGKKRVKV